MANRRVAKMASQEQYFYEYVDQLDRHRADRLALVVTLSGIDTSRARQSTQNLVCDHIKRHMAGQSFQMFVFDRGDVAVLTKDVSAGFLQDMAFGLVFQLQGEAFFEVFENGEADLCRMLDVEADYKVLKTYAKTGLHKGPLPLPGEPMAGAVAEDDELDDDGPDDNEVETTSASTPDQKQLTEDQLPDNLVARFVDMDFSQEDDRQGFREERDPKAKLETVRDEIIRIGPKGKPEIIMSHFAADEDALVERFLENADDESRAAYLPGIMQEAEQRLLTLLSNDDPHLLPEKMAIAVQSQTLLSGAFLTFDRMRANQSILPRSMLVVDRRDVRANRDTFKFAQEFVEGRGHQLGIKGLGLMSLAKVRLRDAGFIMQFVEWDGFEASLITKKEKMALRAGVEDEGSATTVLTGCTDEDAIEFGKEIGITLFEGRAAAQALFHVDYASSNV